jgi:predicted ATPase
MNILWFAAQCRESLLGLMLYLYYWEKNNIEHSDVIIELYITEILHMADHYVLPVSEIIKELYVNYYNLIEQRTALDDNQKYMQLAVTNRNKFTKWLEKTQIKNNLIGEDIMRLRWFLKNISYYNKRFVIPQ